MCLNRFMDS